MHDPMVVAFEIRNPIPRRHKSHDAKPGKPRWRWSPPFATVAGRGIYWRSLITVWHVEPGGRDALSVCGYDADGRRNIRSGRWRWHIRHWKIQVSPLQRWRRALLTRCEECGRRGSPNISHQWDRDHRQRWWKGERGLYHLQCSSLRTLRNAQADADRLTLRILDAYRVTTDMTRDEALDWFVHGVRFDTGMWRAARSLRYRLDKETADA